MRVAITVSGKTFDAEGYDLLGLITGSEGLLCIITEVIVKILKKPQAVKAALIGFPTIMSISSNPFNPLSATSFATFPKSLEIL